MTPVAKYKNSLSPHLRANNNPSTDLLSIVNWYHVNGRNEFIDTFEKETKLNLKGINRSDGALLEHGFPKNINEYTGKTAWDQYYIANGLIALKEIDRLTQAYQAPPAHAPEIYFRNGLSLARRMLLDTLVLLEDWATFAQQLPGFMGVGKNRFEQGVALYHSALQVIYGHFSPLSFSDNHSDTSINQLRMAIEVRLRRGFGIIAKEDMKGALVPLALSDVFKAIRRHQDSVNFSVPLKHVERLYGWANIYMHSALKQYAWSPIFALHYVRPFILGGSHPRGVSVHAGVRTSYGVVRQIQSAVESGINKKHYKLLVEDPAYCDLILEP